MATDIRMSTGSSGSSGTPSLGSAPSATSGSEGHDNLGAGGHMPIDALTRVAQQLDLVKATLTRQSHEFAAQRDEAAAQRDEMAAQTEALGGLQIRLKNLKVTFTHETQNLGLAVTSGFNDLQTVLQANALAVSKRHTALIDTIDSYSQPRN